MRVLLIHVLLLLSYNFAFAQTDIIDTVVEESVYTVVERMPQFPGGEAALQKFLSTEMRYPELCKIEGIEGKVYVQFVVRENGKLSDFNVLRSPNPELSKEALRILKKSPDWIPGSQNGINVPVRFNLPIRFILPPSFPEHNNSR